MRLRDLAFLPLTALLALGVTPPASARDLSDVPPEVRSGPAHTSSGGHFLIHYAEGGSHAIPAARARDLADYAENAWQVEVGRWGWPAPLDDGNGPLDIYVYRFAAAGAVTPDRSGGATSSWMAINPDYVNPVTVAHELLHMSQHAITGDYQGQVLTEGLGHWAGFAVTDTPYPPHWAVADPSASFGCVGWFSCVSGQWAFFQFVAERYGHDVLIDAYRRAPALGGPAEQRAVPAIDAALQARGSSLADAFSAYAGAVTTADFGLRALRRMRPEPAAEMRIRCRGRAERTLTVDHLAARWVRVSSLCFSSEATLRLSVSWPAGLASVRPAIGGAGSPIHGLAVRPQARSVTARIPAAVISDVLVGLPNPGLRADDQPFRVSVQSTRRPRAHVRVLSPPRARRGAVSVRLRSSRRVWLGLGFSRAATQRMVLVQATRGVRTLRVPIPRSLPAGRYYVSIYGARTAGQGPARIKVGGRSS